MEGKTIFQETRENALADTPSIFWIRKIRRVFKNIFLIVWIFRHGHNTVNVFEDSLTEAIIVRNIHVGEISAIDLRQKLARFSCVVTLSQEQTNVSLRGLKLLGHEDYSPQA